MWKGRCGTMSEFTLTAAQQAAVDNEGGALLVAAAAGSGKTKVLVDRLLRKVLDPDHPHDLDEYLIITYTKAAAAELRTKISNELSRRAAMEPENRHLQRQMHRIYQTKISTIHAFCSDLLRSYGHLRDIPGDFRIAEEAETRILRDRVKERVLDQLYEPGQADPEQAQLLSQLGYGRDDRALEQVLFTIYDQVQSFLDPEGWLESCRSLLQKTVSEQDAGKTLWGKSLLEQMTEFLTVQKQILQADFEQVLADEVLQKAYGPVLADNVALLDRLLGAKDWDSLVSARPDSFGRLGPAKKCQDPELMERIKADRSRCWDGLKQQFTYFYGPSREVLEDLRRSSGALQGAIRLTQTFIKAYQKEKRRRRILDFSDLEHETVALLLQKGSGTPTALAREVASSYAEILIDEYQDSNQVQDEIFRAVSREGRNLFFVGDVKQSIYRFRLADPRIFLKKYQSYQDAASAEAGKPRRILLSENFRSRKEILDGVNQVFETVMSPQVGDMAYTEAEKLKPGLPSQPSAEPAVELHCIALSGPDREEGKDKTHTEAEFVARRIRQLIKSGTKPGEIAVLFRSLSSVAPVYLEQISALGIPAVSDKAESILGTQEAETLLALLQVLENPHQDVPLVTLLASPLFSVTAEELSRIRQADRTGDLYESLCAMDPVPEKSARFLETLSAMRREEVWLTPQEMVERAVEETELLEVFSAMEDGLQRRSNLQTILQVISDYLSENHGTLLELIGYLQGLEETGAFLAPQTQDPGNAVRLMSIHKSKGLEFPVVFLPDLSKKFNDSDLTQEVLLHETMGLGGNCFDPATVSKFPTIAKRAIALSLQRENRSEELRILYVAMTRAKERLIMSYCSRYLEKELTELSQEAAFPAPAALCRRAKSMGSWVLTAALCRPEAQALHAVAGRPRRVYDFPDTWTITFRGEAPEADTNIEAAGAREEAVRPAAVLPTPEQTAQALAFQYPWKPASLAPAKVTATQLKGRYLDEEAASGASSGARNAVTWDRKPIFRAEGPLTAAERGTATHLFLQFAKYDACQTEQSLLAERRRLVGEEFLTPRQAEAVDLAAVLRLFRSPLGQRMLRAENRVREFKFSCLVPSEMVEPSLTGESVLLQGVVDCFLVEPDGICVIDFKTDRVTPETLSRRAEGYRRQVTAYAWALEQIYKRPVKEKILYFFALDEAVSL